MIPRTLPAVASPRPPSVPPDASTLRSALRPRTHATGAHSWQKTMPMMPRMSAGIAPSALLTRRRRRVPGGRRSSRPGTTDPRAAAQRALRQGSAGGGALPWSAGFGAAKALVARDRAAERVGRRRLGAEGVVVVLGHQRSVLSESGVGSRLGHEAHSSRAHPGEQARAPERGQRDR